MSLQYQHRLYDYHSDDSSYAHFLLEPRLGNGCICDVVDQRCHGCSSLHRYTLCSYEGRRPWDLVSTAWSSSTIDCCSHHRSWRRCGLSLRRHLCLPSGSCHHRQLSSVGVGLPLAVIIDAVILARFFDRAFDNEAASLPTHDALRSTRPRKL